MPGELAASVGAIGQRNPPEEVRALVIALCQFRAWRTEELSDLLRRRPETIRQHYLRPLMREGRLLIAQIRQGCFSGQVRYLLMLPASALAAVLFVTW